MESRFVRRQVLVLMLSFLTQINVEVEGTTVTLSDDYNTDFTSGQNAYIIQGSMHTFQCSVQSLDAVITWELENKILQHSAGYPNDTTTGDTVSQVSIDSDLEITDHQLRCRVTVMGSIIQPHVVLRVQVPPVNVVIYKSDIQSGYGNQALVTVTEDSRETLLCAAPATSRIPRPDVSWNREDFHNFQDAEINTRQANENDGRLSDEISVLTFTPQRSHHRELLVCTASLDVPNIAIFPEAPVSAEVRLNVDGPPDTPYLSGSLITVERKQHIISCDAEHAYPDEDFRAQWYLDGTDITSHARHDVHADSEQRYNLDSRLIYTFTREHNQQELRCSVTHPTLSSPLQSEPSVIEVEFCPRSVTTIVNNLHSCPTSLVMGDQLKLTCKASTSNPAPVIKLYINGIEQDTDSTPIHQESEYHGWTTESVFTSPPIITTADASIDIKCCAVVEGVCSEEICSETCTPDVYYPPVFQTIFVPQDQKREGDSALLTCDVDAVPTPDGFVKWYKDGESIGGSFDKDRNRLLYNIQRLTRQDAGSYYCVANNGIGKKSSPAQNLTVIYGPLSADQKTSKNINVVEGNRVELSATIQSNPISDVQWTSPTGPINATGDDRYELETVIVQPDGYEDDVRGTTIRATLIIKSVSMENDTGQFSCNASNGEGDLKVSFMVGFSEIPLLLIIIPCSSAAGVIAVIAAGLMIKSCRRKHCCSNFGKSKSDERKKSNKSVWSFQSDPDFPPEKEMEEAAYVNTPIGTPMGSVTDVRMPPSPVNAVGCPDDLYDSELPVPPSPKPFPRLKSGQSPKPSPKSSPKPSPLLPKKNNENMYTTRAPKYEERVYDPVAVGVPGNQG